MRNSEEILNEITKTFGFVPPFFAPAVGTPQILENLWQQTLSAYVKNPIPDLFKEKLAALVARYCSVPYCLVCHSSTLRPLGMKSSDVLKILDEAPLSSEDLEREIRTIEEHHHAFPLKEWPSQGSDIEDTILHCSVAVFLHIEGERCLVWLRKVLSPAYYDYLNLFIAYNRTCLSWAESHPELSYEADFRAQSHLGGLIKEEPLLAEFFNNYSVKVKTQSDQRFRWLTEENRRLVEIEREAVRKLEEEKRVIQKFMDTITHDLRNPLTVIKMNIELSVMEIGKKDPVCKKLSRALAGTSRMDRMIEDLLDASKLRSGITLKLEKKNQDVLKILKEIYEDQQCIIGDRLHFESDTETLAANINEDAFRRVLENLIGNAVKHGDPVASIKVSFKKHAKNFSVSVCNFGSVLSEEQKKAIFTPFYRANTASQGWGIGLTVVKSLVDAHEGSIHVESSSESGTVFTVTMPLT